MRKILYVGCTAIVAIVILAAVALIAFTAGANSVQQAQAPTAAPTTRAPRPTATPALTESEIRKTAVSVTYDNLARNTEEWIGKLVYVRGEVIEVVESDGKMAAIRVRMQDGQEVYDALFVHYSGERLLVGDTIDLYATVKGRYTYTTILGATVTIPELTSVFAKRHFPQNPD